VYSVAEKVSLKCSITQVVACGVAQWLSIVGIVSIVLSSKYGPEHRLHHYHYHYYYRSIFPGITPG